MDMESRLWNLGSSSNVIVSETQEISLSVERRNSPGIKSGKNLVPVKRSLFSLKRTPGLVGFVIHIATLCDIELHSRLISGGGGRSKKLF